MSHYELNVEFPPRMADLRFFQAWPEDICILKVLSCDENKYRPPRQSRLIEKV